MCTISIITICHDNLGELIRTIESSDSIFKDEIEHLIIDGASNDGTQAYLRSIQSTHIKWISEPDDGIYNAMNKGLKMAKGDYVIFMNAGDSFSPNDVLSEILECIEYQKPDIIFSETLLVNDKYKIQGTRSQLTTKELPKVLNKNSLSMGMVVCHQSIVMKKSIASTYIENNLSADYDWLLNGIKRSNKIVRLDRPISLYLMGGTSKKNQWKSLKDRWTIMRDHYGLIGAFYNHLLIIKRLIRKALFDSDNMDYV